MVVACTNLFNHEASVPRAARIRLGGASFKCWPVRAIRQTSTQTARNRQPQHDNGRNRWKGKGNSHGTNRMAHVVTARNVVPARYRFGSVHSAQTFKRRNGETGGLSVVQAGVRAVQRPVFKAYRSRTLCNGSW